MKRRIPILMLALLPAILSPEAQCGQYETPHSLALAGSFTAVARDFQALGINPANLALSDGRGFSLNLFSAGVSLSNNAFTLNDYNTYNGESWSESDKTEILSKIPAAGLAGNVQSGLSLLSFSVGNLAIGLTGEGAGSVAMPREVVDLILNGNTIGDSLDLSNVEGQATAHADLNLSYGSKVYSASWGAISCGVNLKYIRGLAHYEIVASDGYLATHDEYLSSQGAVQIRSSEGGSGFGLDFGLALEQDGGWVVSCAVTNLIGNITWTKHNRQHTYQFLVNRLTLDNSDEDSTIQSEDREESIGPFSSSPAPQLALGAAKRYKSLQFSLDYKQGFVRRDAVTTTPEIALGCEWSLIKFLPLRAGVSVGGIDGTSAAVGLAINLKSIFLDLACASAGSLLPVGGKGLGLGLSSGIRF